MSPTLKGLAERIRGAANRSPEIAVNALGLPPAWTGYRSVQRESVREYMERTGDGRFDVVHPEIVHENPLPRNIASRSELPADRGWWGFSFRDVPSRRSEETFVATLTDCRVICYEEDDPSHRFVGDFYVALLNRDDHSLELREVTFRRKHGEILRGRPPVQRLEKVTWILERVYHNHSHWLTAHVPKLNLLKARGMLDHLVLPTRTTPVMETSLRILGIDASRLPRLQRGAVLRADELTIVGSDRFRPELLRSVRTELGRATVPTASRKIYISRARAGRRQLRNEPEVWAVLQEQGFERVFMEELSFEAQIRLMEETAVLVAPHGAGLTNMIFCQPGTEVVEIADLSFPNPNFYAMASALGHSYWLVEAEPAGGGDPLKRDMVVSVPAISDVLARLAVE